MAKTMRKKKLKIQILTGSTLMSRFNVGFEIELPLAFLKHTHVHISVYLLFTLQVLKSISHTNA